MEINITQFYNDANPATYSASVAELGDNAGRITWDNALGAPVLLDTPDKLGAMRAWAIGMGAWESAWVNAWNDVELNALFIQRVSGDIREMDGMSWEEYQELSEAGQVSGALFEADGQIYYTLEG